jgi:hypothetical protein
MLLCILSSTLKKKPQNVANIYRGIHGSWTAMNWTMNCNGS